MRDSTTLSERQSIPTVVAAVAISAALFYFGTGLDPVPVLTWLAPLPILLIAPRIAAWPAAGAAFAAFGLSTANSWAFYYHSHDVPLWPMGVIISLGFSLDFALSTFLFRALVRRGKPLSAAVVASASWTALLVLAATFNPSGIAGTLLTTQSDLPVLLQITALLGSWSLEFLVVLVPAAIAAILAPAIATRVRYRTAAVMAAVVALVLGGGAMRLAAADNGPDQQVALVVHNRSPWGVDIDTPQGRDLRDAYLAELAALPSDTTVAVLPEGNFSVTDANLDELTGPLASLATERKMTIVVGYVRKAEGAKFNTALAIPANGFEPAPYVKQHDFDSRPGDDLVYVPGAEPRTGMQICADLNFPDPSRDYAADGAHLMLIPAADNVKNGWQHARSGQLRGVENGFAVAWSGARGALTISDGYGRVLAEDFTSDDDGFTTVTASVPAGPGATVYTYLGDWFGWLCLLVTLAGLVIAVRRTPTLPSEADSSDVPVPADTSNA